MVMETVIIIMVTAMAMAMGTVVLRAQPPPPLCDYTPHPKCRLQPVARYLGMVLLQGKSQSHRFLLDHDWVGGAAQE